jgi:predicted TIM-barrel fold metal-dependent hydrolase
MRFFDANVQLGRYNDWSGREPITVPDLLATMDHYGIHDALVMDTLSHGYHPLDGNARILQVTAGQPRLHPAWALLPPRSRELPPPDELAAQMEELGVRAVFLYPQQYHFTLDEWSVDGLLRPLAERRVPVFICPDETGGTRYAPRAQDLTDWPGVVRLCRAFPDLPVVVVENRISYSLRAMYQALDACPNLHIELSTLWLHHLVEFICREWGPERLLFGSGLPRRDPGAALGQLVYADISPEALTLVAGANVRRLLAWNPKRPLPEAAVQFPEPLDELHALIRDRQPLRGQGFHCAHGHLGRTHLLHIPDTELEKVLEEMDRLGVERSIVFANGGLASDEIYGNDLVAAAVRAYPGRFIGCVVPNLQRPPAEIVREVECGFAMGLLGIKIHPHFNGYDTNGPNVELVCALANARRTFIINHDWGSTERMVALCRQYPHACLMTGHTSPQALPATQEVPNLYIGTCPLNAYGTLERFVAEAGAERLIFGSDLLWDPIGWGIGPILYGRIPPEAKRLILGGNIRRLLGQYGAGGAS